MTAIEKVLSIAEAEVGYLEKKSNSQLDSKTANAGSGNYTKYWRDIKPEFQGSAWCACFVTWCFAQAFGRDAAKKLLKHYPYTYCPTMADLFELHANPQKGDIVIFWRNGTFAHTGIVRFADADGNRFGTYEGNTSSGSDIIPNGGAVCAKTYYNNNLPGTKFCRPDYSMVEEDFEMGQYVEVDQRLREISKENDRQNDIINKLGIEVSALYNKFKTYDTINDVPSWYRDAAQKLIDKGILHGDENGKLNLTDTEARIFTALDRAGIFG